jgi:hypothetical protein
VVEKNRPDFCKRLRAKGRQIGNIPKEVHFTHWAAERTIDFIKNYEKDDPFFYFMSVVDPHDLYSDFPLEMYDLVNENKIPDPITEDGDYHLKPEGI